MSNPYTVELSEEAEKDLDDLDKTIRERIIKRIQRLADHAADVLHESLTDNWSGYQRIKTGDWRIIY